MYVVALQSHQHIEDLLVLSRMMRDEVAPTVPYDDARVIEICQWIKETVGQFTNVWLCYTHEHEPVGFIVGNLVPYFFNYSRFAEQDLVYVIPSKRSTMAFYRLMEAYEKWSAKSNALQSFTGVIRTEAKEVKRIGKVFAKFGYALCGNYYKKDKTQ